MQLYIDYLEEKMKDSKVKKDAEIDECEAKLGEAAFVIEEL
jgi:hypothetical protein